MSVHSMDEQERRTRRAVIGGAAIAGVGAGAALLPQSAAAADTLDGVTTNLSGIAPGDTLLYTGTQLAPETTEYVWVKPPTTDPVGNRQAVIDAITQARDTKRAVHLRRGTYVVDQAIAWTGAAGDPSVVIRGFGDDSLIRCTNASVRILSFTSANGLTLESFAVEGPGTGRDNGQTGVRVSTSANVTIRDVTVSGSCGSGINLVGCTFSRVLDCRVRESWSDGIGVYGSGAANGRDIIIAGNFVYRAGDDGISVVRFRADATVTDTNADGYNAHHLRIQILGNNVREGGANGIHVVGGRHVQVHSNLIDGTRAVGILVDRDANSGPPANPGTTASQIVQVQGNIVRRAGRVVCPGESTTGIPSPILVPNAQTATPVNRYGIYVSAGTVSSDTTLRTNDITVVDNEIHETAGRGVVVRGRTNGTVVGNTVRDATSTGFDVAGSDAAAVIEGLVFARNRSHDVGGTGVSIKFVQNGVVEGSVVRNSNSGSDNFRFEGISGVTIRDNHSVDDRATPSILYTYEFTGTCTDLTLSANRERAGTKTAAFTGTISGVRQTEPVVYAAGAQPPASRYAEGQLALQSGGAALLVKVGTAWKSASLA